MDCHETIMSEEEIDVLVALMLAAERFEYIPLPLCAPSEDVTVDDYCEGRPWLRSYPNLQFVVATLTKYRIPPEALRVSKLAKLLPVAPKVRTALAVSATSKFLALQLTDSALPAVDMPTTATPIAVQSQVPVVPESSPTPPAHPPWKTYDHDQPSDLSPPRSARLVGRPDQITTSSSASSPLHTVNSPVGDRLPFCSASVTANATSTLENQLPEFPTFGDLYPSRQLIASSELGVRLPFFFERHGRL